MSPASYVTHPGYPAHDRRPPGHWLIDGIPIPNTNIATNLGPQILTPETSTTWRSIAVATTPTMETDVRGLQCGAADRV